MKIGNVVRIARPHTSDISYKDAIGVVEFIFESAASPKEMICYVRCISINAPCTHIRREIFQHRLDLIRE